MTDAVGFEARLASRESKGSATFLTLPFDVAAVFGRSRCPVRVTVKGHTWRTTTQVYGSEYHVAVSAAVRTAVDIAEGELVYVTVKQDDTIRAVDVPPELAARLRTDPQAKDAFEALPASHRREYARWVAGAKLPETRRRRSAAATERLKSDLRKPQSA